MASTEETNDKQNITHNTEIGNVTGQVHAGSGDIHVGSFLVGRGASTKEEFLFALDELKQKIEAAEKEGVSDEVVDDVTTEVEAAAKETKKDAPKVERIVKRLENAKAILAESASVATAATITVKSINKLIPLIETAIQSVNKIF